MRPLTREETEIFFTKLAKYIGRGTSSLINEEYVFRLHQSKIYYLPAALLKTTFIARKQLISIGTLFGKFTKTMKCRLSITCLDYLSKLAVYKVWIKSGEMSFMYGNHVLKAHIGRMTEDIPEHSGVLIYTMQDVCIGFGVTAQSTMGIRKMASTGIAVYHQADVGEYLREQDIL